MANTTEYDVKCGLCLNEEIEQLIQCVCRYFICFDCQHKTKKLYCPNCDDEVNTFYINKLIKEEDPLVIDHYISKNFRYDALKENNNNDKQLLFDSVKKTLLTGKSVITNIVGKCPECNKSLINRSDSVEIDKCISCNYTACAYCKEVHPKDQACNKDILENIKSLEKIAQKCPGCYGYVSKIDGCDHMRCLSCGTQFGWYNGKENVNYEYLNKRDANIIYKPESKVEVLPIINVEQQVPVFRKKTMLTNKVSDFVSSLKDKIKGNINSMINKLSEQIEKEYKNDTDESDYETILSRVPMIYKKKLYKNILILEFISSIKYATKEGITKTYEESDLPDCYKISWDDITKSITSTEIVDIKGEVAAIKKNNCIKPLNYKQERHVINILKKIKELGTCIDTSPAGSGKTYTALLSAIELKVKKVLILCPITMKVKWTEVISDHKQTNNMEFIIKPYSSLIMTSLKKSGLIRLETINEKIIVHLSDFLKSWLKDNTLIIVDESHHIKSPSSFGFKFMSSLSSFALENEIPLISMSATPITSLNDSLVYIKKLLPNINDNPYNKKAILKFPRFERFVYSSSEEKNPYYRKLILEESLDSIKKMIEHVNGLPGDRTYITKKLTNPDNVALFGRDFTDDFEYPGFLEILKNIVILEKYYDLRSEEFWESNFCNDDITAKEIEEQTTLPLINNEIVKNDLTILGKVFNSTVRFNYIFVYFSELYKGFSRFNSCIGQRVYNRGCFFKLRKKILLVELVQFFFFLYGIPLRFCSLPLMESITKEKLITILINKHITNIKDVPDDGEGYIDHSKNLKVYNLLLETNESDTQKMNKMESEFSLEQENQIINFKIQDISKVIFNLQISEVILSNYIYDLIKHIRNEKRNIVIAFSYNNTIDSLKEKCEKDKIVYDLINGSVKDKQSVIDKFQREKGILLFINMSSLNTGVDLDDKTGDTERFVFIIPNYDITKMTQFMFRFQRINSKSNSRVFIIENQLRIIESMNKKLNFIKKNFETSFSVFNDSEKISSLELVEKYTN